MRLFCILASLWVASVSCKAVADDLHVPSQYPTIQDAADAARDGDTIVIAFGVYTESVNLPDMSLNIVGQGPLQTILTGNLLLQNDGSSGEPTITVRDLAFSNDDDGIFVERAGLVLITNCTFDTIEGVAIEIDDLTIGLYVGDSEFNQCGDAMKVDGAGTGQWTIVESTKFSNGGRGFYLRGVDSRFTNCDFDTHADHAIEFYGNYAEIDGCSFRSGAAPAVRTNGGTHIVRNSRFEDNIAGTSANAVGAALSCSSGTSQLVVELDKCIFERNSSYSDGGAVFVRGGAGSYCTIKECEFIENTSGIGEFQNFGGGCAVAAHLPTLTIEDCIFLRNAGNGPGCVTVYVEDGVVSGCLFDGNGYTPGLGEADYTGGGALCLEEGRLLIADCLFKSNKSSKGGALMIPEGSSCWVLNSKFYANRSEGTGADDGGGAILGSQKVYVANCELVGNTAIARGGAFAPDTRHLPDITACTFFENSAPVGNVAFTGITGTVNLTNSLIVSSLSSNNLVNSSGMEIAPHPSNILTDDETVPSFMSVPDAGGDGWGDDPATLAVDESSNNDYGNVRLGLHSVAINAGNNSIVPTDIYDINGDGDSNEPITGSTDSDDGLRFVGPIDLGAYEVQLTPCPADVNGDGLVTPADFTAWINAFNNQLPQCDQNGDGMCTPADFTSWIANFNKDC